MNLVVISCWNYRDVWPPFFALLDRFWPNHPKPVLLHDGEHEGEEESKTWCETLMEYCQSMDEPFLMMQEDFFLQVPVREDLLFLAEDAFNRYKPGCFRIYPSPGADSLMNGGDYGRVNRWAQYRLSCQASIWNPKYLASIIPAVGSGRAYDFEILCQEKARSLPDEVLAWNRASLPWPMEYFCSAVTRGKWNPGAKTFCDSLGIEVDWSKRPFDS